MTFSIADQPVELHRIRLSRAHASCPWGIVISGTDDVVDAPVYIDSLTPGKPGALSELLQPGDRILAVNDLGITNTKFGSGSGGVGLTLSAVKARLQQPSEQVTLFISRAKPRSEFMLHCHGNSDPMATQFSWGTVSYA